MIAKLHIFIIFIEGYIKLNIACLIISMSKNKRKIIL